MRSRKLHKNIINNWKTTKCCFRCYENQISQQRREFWNRSHRHKRKKYCHKLLLHSKLKYLKMQNPRKTKIWIFQQILGVPAFLLHLPTQIRFAIGGGRVTCHGSKLTNSLWRTGLTNIPRERTTSTFDSNVIMSCSLKPGKFVSQSASSKQFLRSFYSIFELGGITKHLMTGPTGNTEFCFPSTSMTLRISGKQNSLFPLVPVIKCSLLHSD